MQRAQVMDAGETGVPAPRDDGAAMAAALHRLAALRATIYRDWSDGPSSLVEHANIDSVPPPSLLRARAYVVDPPPLDFANDPSFGAEPPPLELRGRFDCNEDMPPAPAAADDDEEIVSFGAVGAAAGLAAFLALADLPLAKSYPPAKAMTPDQEEDVSIEAYGASPGLIAWLDAPLPAPAPRADVTIAAFVDVDQAEFALGAVVGCLALDAPELRAAPIEAAAAFAETESATTDLAVGAIGGLVTLLDLTPAASIFTPPPIVDLDAVALDDLLANACEALYVAALDPTENYAWGASVLATGEAAHADMLSICETALWNLPRVVPCGEAFTLAPNHEIAVKITRALRVRADTLRARAFTEHVTFGALRTADSHLPWFPSVEMPVDAGSDIVDADTQFAALDMDDLAAKISAPDRPLPILSEAELDALLSTPAARDSHELDDTWQENPVWQETFWHDVDAYLQSVEGPDYEEAQALVDDRAPQAQDIEFRDEQIAATHFWLPGDDADLAIVGDGNDLFLIGGGDAGVVLVEDGAVHSMRTGRGTRMGEVVVSWSTDAWTDVDAMTWARVATLSNVSQLRVEQTITHDRTVVIAGDLSGSTLSAGRVRLTEATEQGPRDFPVRRLGSVEADPAAWPFADLGGAGADEGRLFV
jgi:hypothetical protein